MARPFFFLSLFLFSIGVGAQDIQVEYDKARDFSQYKTFRLGEGEIITPKDKRVVKDVTMHNWVRAAIKEELQGKGFVYTDSANADLVASYIIGALERSDIQYLGPMGGTPGSNDQTWSRDFMQSSLVIDLNDRKNFLVWRISAVTSSTSNDAGNMIKDVVSKGFKKLSLKPKKEKKRKN